MTHERSIRLSFAAGLARVLKSTARRWSLNGAPLMGAGLAYYAVFSIVPLLALVISLTAWLFDSDAARGQVMAHLRAATGAEVAHTLEGWLQDARRDHHEVWGAWIGGIVTLVGATTLLAHLQASLDRLWVGEDERGFKASSMIRMRLTALAVVLCLGLLASASMVAGSVLSALTSNLEPILGVSNALVRWLDIALGYVLAVTLFGVIFRVMPTRRVPWRHIWIGAAVTALLIALGRLVIAWYLRQADLASTYGAAGSFAAVLVWVYYSAQVLLLGAQFTWVLAEQDGARGSAVTR